MSVKKVVASAVVVIVPIEIDEGTGYLYDIGEGKLLFLAGQQYFPIREEEDSLWPTDAFEVVRMSQGDYWIGIFCSGQLLEPRRVVPASEWREDFVFEHCEDVIEAKLDEYVASRIAKPPGSAG